MANHKTHLTTGVACGVAAGIYTARHETGGAFVAEIAGAAAGGAIGGALPDLFEPAIHSWHRSTAHSVTTAAALGLTAIRTVPKWQHLCRMNAIHHDVQQASAPDFAARAWHAFMALLWRFLSGFVAGLPAGYLSHLALDACTPRCIPLLA